jgi:hypothetical protein
MINIYIAVIMVGLDPNPNIILIRMRNIINYSVILPAEHNAVSMFIQSNVRKNLKEAVIMSILLTLQRILIPVLLAQKVRKQTA